MSFGEIETKILDFPGISLACVTKKTTNNHEILCAYYTASESIDIANLRAFMGKSLPTYMIPQYFTKLDKLPYTPNGKIDTKQLPIPSLDISRSILNPRNEIDVTLITILEKLLKIDSINISNSFLELGGDSLTAINLSAKLYKDLGISISVKNIFEFPVIMDLSDYIVGATAHSRQDICGQMPLHEDKDFYRCIFITKKNLFNIFIG